MPAKAVSLLINSVLFFSYYIALIIINNEYLYVLSSELGSLPKPLDFETVAGLVMLSIMVAWICASVVKTPGDIVILLLALIVIPSGVVLAGANEFIPHADNGKGLVWAIVLGVLIISLFNKIKFKRSYGVSSEGGGCIKWIALVNISVLALIVFYSYEYFSLDFKSHYIRRLLSREVYPSSTLIGYAVSIGTQALFPLIFAWGVTHRSCGYCLLGFINAFVLWGAFGQKFPVLMLFTIGGVTFFFLRYRKLRVSSALLCALSLLLIAVVEVKVNDYSYINDYLLRRAYAVPATLLGGVESYMAEHGSNFYMDTALAALMNIDKEPPITLTLGTYLYPEKNMNANVNFFAVAYMHGGLWSSILESVIVGFVCVLLNYLYQQKSSFIAIPIATIFASRIIEQSLLTVWLSSGFLIMLVLALWMASRIPATHTQQAYRVDKRFF